MIFIDPNAIGPEKVRKDMEQLRAQWQPYVAKMPGPRTK